MVATARFLPVKIITDRAKIRAFAKATSPVIKLVDPLIGEKVNSLPGLNMCLCCSLHFCHLSCLLFVCCQSALVADAIVEHGLVSLCLLLKP